MMHLKGTITASDGGGFVAVASTERIDRDGERVLAGAFNPLPRSIPVHMDHVFSTDHVAAFARPYYEGKVLMIDATFGSHELGMKARTMVNEGTVQSVSIAFSGKKRQGSDGVTEIYAGDLYAADLVTVPSNPDARVLSTRSLQHAMSLTTADARAAALLALAEVEIAQAMAALKGLPTTTPKRGVNRRFIDLQVRHVLNQVNPRRSL